MGWKERILFEFNEQYLQALKTLVGYAKVRPIQMLDNLYANRIVGTFDLDQMEEQLNKAW